MKYLTLFVAILLIFFAVPCFIPSDDARQRALAAGFTEAQIERGWDYTWQRQLLFWPRETLQMALLLVLVAKARRLADSCAYVVRGWWLPTILLMGLFIVLCQEAINLPFALVRLQHSRAWGLTQRSTADWLGEHLLSLAVANAIGAVVLTGFYCLVRLLPRTWWLACSLATPLLGLAFAFLLPLFIAPLFNTFTPLDQSKWKQLEPALEYLLKKAHVDVSSIMVVDASRQGGHTNAYFTGFGSSRRVVLYDTLLQNHYDKLKGPQKAAEVESIFAHELGHWLHHHIIKGIALASLGSLLGLYLLYRFLNWMKGRPPCYLGSTADPAGLPLILLCIALAEWATMPVQNVVSRYFETQADEMSLELAGQPEAFIEATRRLSIDNISQLDANPLRVFLYYSHPPAVERIGLAEQWRKAHKK